MLDRIMTPAGRYLSDYQLSDGEANVLNRRIATRMKERVSVDQLLEFIRDEGALGAVSVIDMMINANNQQRDIRQQLALKALKESREKQLAHEVYQEMGEAGEIARDD